MRLMKYKIYINDLDELDLEKKQVINTINPHSYITAKNDKLFEKALMESDILIPDGSGIVLAAKQINNVSIRKLAGADLHEFLLKKMNESSGKVFYMGASENTLIKIEKRIKKDYPNIIIGKYSPPYKKDFSNEENSTIVNRINQFDPDVLFIGMTAPKQEKWLAENKEFIKFKTACSIGAVFDFYAGTVVRPSDVWINLHLEWLFRFLKEPVRLWKRNFISTPLFLFDMIMYKFNLKKDK